MKRTTLIVGAVVIFALGVLVGGLMHRYDIRAAGSDYGILYAFRIDTWTGRSWEWSFRSDGGWEPILEPSPENHP